MFLLKNTINLGSLFTVFALVATILWCGENTITASAQVIRKNVPLDFTGDGRTDWATVANYSSGATGTPLR